MRRQFSFVAVALLIPAVAWSQRPRLSCATVTGPASHLPALPQPTRWQGKFADTLADLLLYAPPPDVPVVSAESSMVEQGRRPIETLWREDPFQVRWSLAMLAVDPMRATTYVARNAAAWYRAKSGEAEPILTLLEGMGNQSYRSIGLRAIKPPVSAAQERLIFRYACDAAWLLEALAADTTYRRMIQKRESHVVWPQDALEDLYAADRLLSGPWHAEVEAMLARGREILSPQSE